MAWGGKRCTTDGAFVRKTNAAQCEEMLNIFLGHFWEGGGVGEDSLAPFL